MSQFSLTIIEIIPRVLLLVVGLLGLVFSVKGRAKGVSGLMVAAFAVMLATTVAGIAWQFVALDAATWSRSEHLSVADIQLIFLVVGIVFDVAAALSWLLVAIAVVKGGRPAAFAQPYPGPAGYPVAQPGYPHPQQPPN
ncbi:hypothetical protein MUY14_29630 [Amycolatopsis sp. FBCC-B4732]|uniref:hypothetical protein n=1 Tax=Amycolatopsis sp. FBCC-B4732 TaxID=3079339 RepID=UPI001FF4632C|nr:hypothetical protein [Amycolatopsis sp. FBCC-B4732]UOX85922.1 hypothetical protein MUY14_29630 [Amycolatopsis sp. FBCC-B4732]